MKSNDVNLEITVDKEDLKKWSLKENIDKMQEQLKEYPIKGLTFKYDPFSERLVICFDNSFFQVYKKNVRNAGRKKSFAIRKDQGALRYSDVAKKLNEGAELKEMLSYTNMTQATYYRHLKYFKESPYFKNLDQTKESDTEYQKIMNDLDGYF